MNYILKKLLSRNTEGCRQAISWIAHHFTGGKFTDSWQFGCEPILKHLKAIFDFGVHFLCSLEIDHRQTCLMSNDFADRYIYKYYWLLYDCIEQESLRAIPLLRQFQLSNSQWKSSRQCSGSKLQMRCKRVWLCCMGLNLGIRLWLLPREQYCLFCIPEPLGHIQCGQHPQKALLYGQPMLKISMIRNY